MYLALELDPSSPMSLSVPLLTILCLILAQWPQRLFPGDPCVTVAVLLLLIVGVALGIRRQPQNATPLQFKVGDLLSPDDPPWSTDLAA